MLVLVATDEGDSSPRVQTGDDDVTVYLDALATLGVAPTVAVLAPGYSGGTMPCNDGGAQAWGVVRLQDLAAATGGVYAAIADGGDCDPVDPAGWLDDAVAALSAE